jgi:hypothetical protein
MTQPSSESKVAVTGDKGKGKNQKAKGKSLKLKAKSQKVKGNNAC